MSDGLTKVAVIPIGAEAPVVVEIVWSLDFVQGQVGGLVDVVALDNGVDVWVHDEGLLVGLEQNTLATVLCLSQHRGQTLVGPVVLTGGVDDEGCTVGLSDEQLAWLQDQASWMQNTARTIRALVSDGRNE